jgi:Tetracyclin repressor-like, C-terminal domain
VTNGVGGQFADDELGEVGVLAKTPSGECLAGLLASVADLGTTWEQLPGRPAMDRLAGLVAACLGSPAADAASTRTAILIWQQLHGAVSLSITRPFIPWPPLADTVTDAVGRLLDGARAEQQTQAL